MKILVQSDDYGFTKGVVAGMCDAFENGLITATSQMIMALQKALWPECAMRLKTA